MSDSLAWMDQAACADVEDNSIFFPVGGAMPTIRKAKRICASCPVKETCLEFAMARPAHADHGIMGGLTARERRTLRKEKKQ